MKILFPFSTLVILIACFSFFQQETMEGAVFFPQKKITPTTEQAIVIEGKINKAILKTSNGCGPGNFLIPTARDNSLDFPSTIRSLSGSSQSGFTVLDTLSGSAIKGVVFRKEAWLENSSVIYPWDAQTPYIIITDNGLFSYSVPDDFDPYTQELSKLNSVTMLDIIKAANQSTMEEPDPIVLYTNDSTGHHNIRFYSYPDLEQNGSFTMPITPEIFEATEDGLFITRQDTTGNYMLYHHSFFEGNLLESYALNDLASNAQEFIQTEDALFILSSPGDSITVLSTINLQDNSLSQSIIYSESGVRATHNEFKNNKQFTFQPISDFPNEILDKQILIFDPVTHQLDTLVVNLELDYFKHPMEVPQGFGYFELQWVGAKWLDGISDTVYIKQYNNVIKVAMEAFPKYINITYGCWVGVKDQELEKIKFGYYPNPASSTVTINLSGLKKDRQYQLKITTSTGKIHYTTELEAYQEIQLPLEKFAKGIYFLNLDTGKNLITKKLVIQ